VTTNDLIEKARGQMDTYGFLTLDVHAALLHEGIDPEELTDSFTDETKED
jgi:hypothetical protein